MSNPFPVIDALIDEPVTLINAFTVPVDEAERFLHRWKDNARIMARQPGFLQARMYRSLVDDVELRFINVAEWESGKALDAARANPEFRASALRIVDDPDLHVTPRPVVYQVALEVQPGDLL
ncbi:antibiotic biosynthesis monooxygenase family protein [Streptomyces vietnamensis]|uniref:antibiotic biosynthesis monooxygenase family protein n=1 Tax=Streptomyces vietnamensis TaxID=362257 RepID=UPI0007C7BBF3|nr:antibiotic biosynthesis monooxygenase family protein [Streptomyces vietnamensis]